MEPKKKIVLEESDSESNASLSDNETSSETEDYESEEIEKSKIKEETSREKKEKSKKTSLNNLKNIEQKSKKHTKKKKYIEDNIYAKKKRKLGEIFDETDISFDMSAENIKPKKIKVSNSLLIESKILTVKEDGGKSFTFPAIVFAKKLKNNKLFDFNIPLSLGLKVRDALSIILKANRCD